MILCLLGTVIATVFSNLMAIWCKGSSLDYCVFFGVASEIACIGAMLRYAILVVVQFLYVLAILLPCVGFISYCDSATGVDMCLVLFSY